MTASKSPTIAHYVDTLDPAVGGTVAHLADLAILTASTGWRVQIVTPRPDPMPANLRETAGVQIIQAPKPVYRARMSKRQLGAVIDGVAGADLVHFHGAWDTNSIQVASRLRALDRPYVVTPHGMLDDWCLSQKRAKKAIFLRVLGRRFLSGAERIFYCAEAERDQSHIWAGDRPSSVIPAAMDLTPYEILPGSALARRDIEGVPANGPFVLFLSRIDPKKNPETLLDAITKLVEQGRRVPVVFAGGGTDEYVQSLKQRARANGIADLVRFVGLVRGDQKVSLLEAASLLALPTHQENFGLVLTEALAARTPVITTKGVDIWPTLERHDAGLICDPTAEAFAAAIATLLDDPEQSARLGDNGREWVFNEMNAKSLSQQFIAAYTETLATNQSSESISNSY